MSNLSKNERERERERLQVTANLFFNNHIVFCGIIIIFLILAYSRLKRNSSYLGCVIWKPLTNSMEYEKCYNYSWYRAWTRLGFCDISTLEAGKHAFQRSSRGHQSLEGQQLSVLNKVMWTWVGFAHTKSPEVGTVPFVSINLYIPSNNFLFTDSLYLGI